MRWVPPKSLNNLAWALSYFAPKTAGRSLTYPELPWAAGSVLWHLTGGVSCGLLPWWRARHWLLPATEDLDDAHPAAATGARFAQGKRDDLGVGSRRNGLLEAPDAEQGADRSDAGLAGRTGQQAVVPDAMEAVG